MTKYDEGDTFDFSSSELEVRAVYLEDRTINWNDGQGDIIDSVWFWFASVPDADRWFAYSFTHECEGEAAEADHSISKSNVEELRKMSIFIGESWDEISSHCEHCVAIHQREAMNLMPASLYREVMGLTLTEINAKREEGRWRSVLAGFESDDLKFSMN